METPWSNTVNTLHFQCMGTGSIPDWGERSHISGGKKHPKHKTEAIFNKDIEMVHIKKNGQRI